MEIATAVAIKAVISNGGNRITDLKETELWNRMDVCLFFTKFTESKRICCEKQLVWYWLKWNMKVNIWAATTVCRALKKSQMLSRSFSKLQHGLTIDCINSFCYWFSPQDGKLRVCLQRTRTCAVNLELTRWSWLELSTCQREGRRTWIDLKMTALPDQVVLVTC